MPIINFQKPGKDEPGYLRRARKALEFKQKLKDEPDPETLDEMVKFLADFVIEPQEREAKLEALWDASEAQFEQLLTVISGEDDDQDPT